VTHPSVLVVFFVKDQIPHEESAKVVTIGAPFAVKAEPCRAASPFLWKLIIIKHIFCGFRYPYNRIDQLSGQRE